MDSRRIVIVNVVKIISWWINSCFDPSSRFHEFKTLFQERRCAIQLFFCIKDFSQDISLAHDLPNLYVLSVCLKWRLVSVSLYSRVPNKRTLSSQLEGRVHPLINFQELCHSSHCFSYNKWNILPTLTVYSSLSFY